MLMMNGFWQLTTIYYLGSVIICKLYSNWGENMYMLRERKCPFVKLRWYLLDAFLINSPQLNTT